jgi:hypothetical protein
MIPMYSVMLALVSAGKWHALSGLLHCDPRCSHDAKPMSSLRPYRAMLFWFILGFQVWGCEVDSGKVFSTRHWTRTVASAAVPKRVKDIPVTFDHKGIEEVELSQLPDGASVFFSFWEGLGAPQKQAMGKLVLECPTFQFLVIVERGQGSLQANEESMEDDLGFPALKCVSSLSVTSMGGGHQYTCYIYKR